MFSRWSNLNFSVASIYANTFRRLAATALCENVFRWAIPVTVIARAKRQNICQESRRLRKFVERATRDTLLAILCEVYEKKWTCKNIKWWFRAVFSRTHGTVALNNMVNFMFDQDKHNLLRNLFDLLLGCIY